MATPAAAAVAASAAAAVTVAAAGGAAAYAAAAAAMAAAVAAATAAADEPTDGRTWVNDLIDEATQLWIDDPESAVAAAFESARLGVAARARHERRRLRNRLAPY